MSRFCLLVYVFRIVLRLPPTFVAFFLCWGGNGGIAGTIVGDRVGMGAGAGMLTGVGVVAGVRDGEGDGEGDGNGEGKDVDVFANGGIAGIIVGD